MCSISGFLAERPIDKRLARDLCRALLFYGMERGDQSAGVHVNGKTVKRAMKPDEFAETPEFTLAFDADPIVALCHTRMPTCGGRGDDQAQPFGNAKATVVHNGFFFDVTGIKEAWGLPKASGVDSELVADFIGEYGVDQLPDFMETTDGPSAIAALYGEKLYFARTGNPIKYSTVELAGGNRLLVFASTKEILLDALKFCFLVPADQKVDGIPEGRLCEVTPKGVRPTGKKFDRKGRFDYDDGFGHTYGNSMHDYELYGDCERYGARKKYRHNDPKVYKLNPDDFTDPCEDYSEVIDLVDFMAETERNFKDALDRDE